MSLQDRTKIWLIPVNPSLSNPKFCPEVSHLPPVDLSVGDIRWQIAVEWLEIAQWSQWRVYTIGNHHRAFEWYRH